jgi:hypothetical protein
MLGNIPETENYDFQEIPQTVRLKGVSFEGRQDIIPNLFTGTEVTLVRDPFNPIDRYAIKVMVNYNKNSIQIGWIPKDLAQILSPEIDAGLIWAGTIEKIIGSEEQIKGVIVKLIHN